MMMFARFIRASSGGSATTNEGTIAAVVAVGAGGSSSRRSRASGVDTRINVTGIWALAEAAPGLSDVALRSRDRANRLRAVQIRVDTRVHLVQKIRFVRPGGLGSWSGRRMIGVSVTSTRNGGARTDGASSKRRAAGMVASPGVTGSSRRGGGPAGPGASGGTSGP